MLAYKSGSLETADRGVESHTDHRSAARTPALNTVTPVAYLNAVVVFCEFFGQTPHGLRYGGDMPLFILEASQPENVHSELANANYHSHDIEQALKRGHGLHEEYPDHAREAIAYAEHNAQEGRE